MGTKHFSPDTIAWFRQACESGTLSRRALAREFCEREQWFDSAGRVNPASAIRCWPGLPHGLVSHCLRPRARRWMVIPVPVLMIRIGRSQERSAIWGFDPWFRWLIATMAGGGSRCLRHIIRRVGIGRVDSVLDCLESSGPSRWHRFWCGHVATGAAGSEDRVVE